MSLGPIVDIVAPHLKGKIKRSGTDNIITLCPFHDDHSPSFWLNTNNGLWICFSCGLRGSLKKFLRLSGLSYSSIDIVMEPVQAQIELFRQNKERKRRTRFYHDPFKGEVILPEALLGVYDYKPKMLVEDGFEIDLLRSLDIGYDQRLDRVTFPLRDLYGNLVGVSGRATLPGDQPRYKVYRGGYRNEKGEYTVGDFGENFDEEYRNFKVESHRFLWNSHNVYPAVLMQEKPDPVVVTEGFKACMWLLQNGFDRTVALTGVSISEDQRDLLIRMAGSPIVLFLDNDEAGKKATQKEGWRLRKVVQEVLVATYPEGYEGKSPDDLTREQLHMAILKAKGWSKWQRASMRS